MFHVCPVCGQGFEARTSNERFCSQKCKNRFFYLGNKKSKVPPESRICAECGKTFIPKTKRSRFCSRNCGEKNRKRREYHEQRARVLAAKA